MICGWDKRVSDVVVFSFLLYCL